MSGTWRIQADENMPGMQAFAELGPVRRFAGRSLRNQDLAATDILLVRSVTRVDATLLEGTPVRFVGSATIGTDHVNRDWLAAHDIGFAHAPGCNAMAVVEYVLQVVLTWCVKTGRTPAGLSIGIVGVGHVGSRLAVVAAALGMRVVPCDPPRQRMGERTPWPWASLDAALDCDVVSLHVPLSSEGRDATVHLLDAAALASLHAGQLLINTSRGPVIDNAALLDRLRCADAPACVLDVWESEPRIPRSLLEHLWLGTPHIAGYSHEGKLRGSWMLLGPLGEHVGQGMLVPALPRVGERAWAVSGWADVLDMLRHGWKIEEDHQRLLASLDAADPARAFDDLRKTYPLRHELSAWSWRVTADMQPSLLPLLTAG